MRIERALRLADDLLRERTSERASETNESDDCARIIMIIDIEREEPLNMMMMRNN